MARAGDSFSPPFCPNPDCVFHRDSKGWRFRKKGFFVRRATPRRIQRYRCLHCHRNFSSQTFHVTYWLKRPDLLAPLLLRSLACSAYRQIAREFSVSPSAIQHQIERLGRHCLLFHELHRPKGPPTEPLVIDGFESFEFSQYSPGHFHLAVGRGSHFFYGFGDSELRRKGRMNDAQKRRRAELEAIFGRPDPQSIEKEMAALLEWVVPPGTPVEIHSDEHPAYPRAFRRLSDRPVVHRTTSSKEPRTSHNPLFPVNLLDLLIRHGSANHKRETIAFSKQRGCAAYRLAILLVWRNYMKPFSERRRDATPAQRLGLVGRLLGVAEVLGRRLFPSRIRLPERWARYYWRRVRTRRLPDAPEHCRVFAV
jgi:transposase-like protein